MIQLGSNAYYPFFDVVAGCPYFVVNISSLLVACRLASTFNLSMNNIRHCTFINSIMYTLTKSHVLTLFKTVQQSQLVVGARIRNYFLQQLLKRVNTKFNKVLSKPFMTISFFVFCKNIKYG